MALSSVLKRVLKKKSDKPPQQQEYDRLRKSINEYTEGLQQSIVKRKDDGEIDGLWQVVPELEEDVVRGFGALLFLFRHMAINTDQIEKNKTIDQETINSARSMIEMAFQSGGFLLGRFAEVLHDSKELEKKGGTSGDENIWTSED